MRLKDKLEQSLQEDELPCEGLRAVVVVAMPDGLVVWSWVDGDRALVAHEFAALGRAASACLSGLEVGVDAMTLALRVESLQVYSWPLPSSGLHSGPSPLAAHFVFDGDLLAGLAQTRSKRARDRLGRAIAEAGLLGPDLVRDSLIDLLLLDTPELALLGLREQGSWTLAELEWPESLPELRRAELRVTIDHAFADRLSPLLETPGVDP